MPAAVVIPAPLAYIKVVAVKKLIGLLYERPFTREGIYLVRSFVCNMKGPSVKQNIAVCSNFQMRCTLRPDVSPSFQMTCPRQN